MRDLGAEREYGSWLLLDNQVSRFASQKLGWHPFVLVQPSDDSRPFSVAYPRSSTSLEGVPHPPHSAPHGCRITNDARIVLVEKRSLERALIVATPVECVEPDPAALRASFKSRR